MNSTKAYWNNRYGSGGNSGYGSYDEQADVKLATIKELVTEVTSITDIGCGDFAFSKRLCDLFPYARYAGYDISDVIIEQNRQQYPMYFFDTAKEAYPPADLVVCIDVLFHFGNKEEQEELLQALEKAWTKYLVLSAADSKNDVSRFGTPLAKVLLEEEDDKSYLYIWKK